MEIDDKTGWVSLYRKTIDSSVFQNPWTWQVWTWCIMKANHKDRTFMFNGKDITIKRGQFVTGREKALKEMPKLSPRKYRTAIEYLKTTSRIDVNATNKFSIITVCKYDEYQNNNLQSDQQKFFDPTNKRPTSDQQTTTNNNDNNDNNENKIGGLASEILNLFFDVDKSINTDPEGNLRAATTLLEYSETHAPELSSEDRLTELRHFFEKCITVDDDYLRTKISLPFIAKEYNRYVKAINKPEKKRRSAGRDDPQKPGTSPDLSQVDSNNRLNEQ